MTLLVNKMLIIMVCPKDEIDIYVLTYNHVHYMLKNKPKHMQRITLNSFM